MSCPLIVKEAPMAEKPEVVWEEKDNVHGGDIVFVEGRALSFGKVKVTVKVIPSNVSSNVYDVEADQRGNFLVAVEIPDAPPSLDSQALITVSAFGFRDTNFHEYHYLG